MHYFFILFGINFYTNDTRTGFNIEDIKNKYNEYYNLPNLSETEYNYLITPKVNLAEEDLTDYGDDLKINNAAKVNYYTINVAYEFMF